MSISEIDRKRNLAEIEKRRIRDSLELGLDDSDLFGDVFEKFSNMEKIVFIHLEYRLSPKFTYTHLGISRQRYNEILQGIRNKIQREII